MFIIIFVFFFLRKINKGNLKGSERLFERITQRMMKILSDHSETWGEEDFDCEGLQIAFSALNTRKADIPNLKSIMKTVAILFSKRVELILVNYIKVCNMLSLIRILIVIINVDLWR